MWCLSPTLLLRAATCSMLTCFMLRPKFWALDQAQGLCQPVSRSGCLPGRCSQGYGLTHGAALASAIRGWHITTGRRFGLGRSIPCCLSLPKKAPLQLGAAEAAATRPTPPGSDAATASPGRPRFLPLWLPGRELQRLCPPALPHNVPISKTSLGVLWGHPRGLAGCRTSPKGTSQRLPQKG